MKAKTMTTEPKTNRMNVKGAIMKKTRKVFALLLTVAMCMAMSVSAFAVGTDPSSEITTKTYELDNSNFAPLKMQLFS